MNIVTRERIVSKLVHITRKTRTSARIPWHRHQADRLEGVKVQVCYLLVVINLKSSARSRRRRRSSTSIVSLEGCLYSWERVNYSVVKRPSTTKFVKSVFCLVDIGSCVWLKTLYVSTRCLITLYFTAFLAMVENRYHKHTRLILGQPVSSRMENFKRLVEAWCPSMYLTYCKFAHWGLWPIVPFESRLAQL